MSKSDIGRYERISIVDGRQVQFQCGFCGALVANRAQHNAFHIEVQSWLDALRFYLDTLKQASSE